MEFLISTGYRTTGKSVIWKLDTSKWRIQVFREDQYYHQGRRKDYIYFGMDIYKEKLFCVGGQVLSTFDLDGHLIDRQEKHFLNDAHDLSLIRGRVFCTNTGHDTIEILTMALEHEATISLPELACFSNKKLLPKNETSRDSLHANFLSARGGEILVTHSFVCERNPVRALVLAAIAKLGDLTGWQPSRNGDIALNIRSGKILSSGGLITTTGRRILSGLYGAHDGVFYNGRFYINSTHNIETLVYNSNFELLQTIQYNVGMLLRGLHPLDDMTVLVGATWIDPQRTASSIYQRVLHAREGNKFEEMSSIKVVNTRTGRIIKSIYLDPFHGVHPEIYKIIPFEPKCDRRSNL